MTKKQIIVSSLAMDLKRAALGLHNNSHATANRFIAESLSRIKEMDYQSYSPKFKQITNRLEKICTEKISDRTAEDLLMYSVLCQNHALTNL